MYNKFEGGRRGILVEILHVLIMVLLSATALSAAQERVPLHVPRLETTIVIDGVLDDAAWSGALRLPLPFEVYPGKNLPASVATECLLAYSREYLYIGLRAHDPDTGSIRAHYTGRDRIDGDDRISITIDTFNSGRRGYMFACNPLGVQHDEFRDDYGSGVDTSWDANWHSAGQLTEGGYVIEMAIPFDQIRFQETDGPQIWGFTAIRIMPRSISYEFATQELDFYVREYFEQFSKIVGFEDVRSGAHVQLIPTVTAVVTDTRPQFPEGPLQEGALRGDNGLTGHWNPTAGLTLSGTINPDFSHIEADVAQLDVNVATVLYYPEKRPFFMSGAGTFTTPIEAVYTRMLADPNWGLKLTGRESGTTWGLLGVGDERTTLIVPGTSYSSLATIDRSSTTSLGRYHQEFTGGNAIGALVTDRRGDGYRNSVFGLDGVWYATDSDSLTGQFIQSESRYDESVAAELRSSETELDGHALHLAWVHNTREFDYFFYYDDVAEGFRADAGYVNRVGYRQLQSGIGYVFWMDRDSPLISHNYWATWQRAEDRDGDLLSEVFTLWGSARGPLQSTAYLYYYDTFQQYEGVDFNLKSWRFYFSARPRSGMVTVLDLNGGDSIDYQNIDSGSRLKISPYIGIRLTRNLELSLRHDFERFSREGGVLYEANLTQARAVLHFDDRSYLRFMAQFYDLQRGAELYRATVLPKSRSLFLQLLYSFVINPQTVLFAGYSDTALGSSDNELHTSERTFFLKLGYAWNW